MVLHAWEAPVKHPYGKGVRRCRITNNGRGIIRKYGLYVSRRCFREVAKDIGFKKYD